MAAWKNVVPAANQQFERKREVLLREASASFNHRGYHGTSLTEIAKKLGVTKAALYTYVPSKEELLYYCHDSAMDLALDVLRTAKLFSGTGLQKLRLTLQGYLEMMLGTEGSYVVLLEENAMKPIHVKAITKRRDAFEKGMRDFINEGIEDGSIIPCNAKIAIFVAMGALNWSRKWYDPKGEWTGPQIAEVLTQMLERGLASSPAPRLLVDPSKADCPVPLKKESTAKGRRQPA
jgi:TetR/AcrR family transcriptional regulator